jgi:hypothetical protein
MLSSQGHSKSEAHLNDRLLTLKNKVEKPHLPQVKHLPVLLMMVEMV